MSASVVPFSTAKSQVMEYLNASTGAYGTYDATEFRWSELGINDAIIDADVEFQRAEIESPLYSRRLEFYQAPVSSISNGSLLPSHLGPLGSVLIQRSNGNYTPGWRAPVRDIQIWSDNMTDRVGTGTIASSSTSLARVSGPLFNQSDVGKTITVAGAGPAAAALVTTISSVDNHNQIATLAVAASTTATGQATSWPGNDDFGGLETTEGSFDIVDDRLWYIGSDAKITFAEISRGSSSGLKSSLECLCGVVAYALGFLLMKDEDHPQAAAYYGQFGNMSLGLIREGKMLPPLMQFEPGRTT